VSEVQVSLVPAEHAHALWPELVGYVESAMDYAHGRYEADDILNFVHEGTHTLWIAFAGDEILGVVVTAFSMYPRKKYLHLVLCAGKESARWKEPMLAVMRRWAVDNGCGGIEGSGRLGWARAFSSENAKVLWQTFELPLGREG